ncbi:hypothetical protein CKAH01_07366 [Colletotrichum kahawae]|uniref:Uncharacterized protein n=1 Tax=Colletotrichum kahawae TaxID=34407 RepID=A0AAD9Y6N2_COLKA|nr:hypothetical protein CKAH01_07366 [Colletotrichum kahawae]
MPNGQSCTAGGPMSCHSLDAAVRGGRDRPRGSLPLARLASHLQVMSSDGNNRCKANCHPNLAPST